MRFLTLRAENFMRLGDVTLPLDNQGLTLLLGENRDAPKASSNGAGKSALLDALCWCLWGKTIRGLSGDEVIRRDVGKDCRVTVEWVDGFNRYKVTRLRGWEGAKKPNDVLFEVDGEVDEGAGMAKTQERIVQALGLNFTTFQAMMPGAGIKVAELTDGGIKDLLEKLLQMDVISKAQDITKEKLKKVNGDLVIEEKNIKLLLEKIDEYEALLTKYSTGQKTFDDDRDAEVLQIQGEVGSLLTRREVVLERVTAMQAARKTLQNVQVQRQNKKKMRSTCQDTMQIVETVRDKKEKEAHAELTGCQIERRLLTEKIAKFDGLGGVCDHCHQTVGADHIKVQTNRLHKDFEALEERGRSALRDVQSLTELHETKRSSDYKAIDRITADIKLLDRQLSDLTTTVTDGEYAEKEAADLWTQIGNLSEKQEGVLARTTPFEGLIADTIEKAYSTASDCSRAKKRALELREKVSGLTFWVDGFSTKGLRSLMLRHVTPILNARAKYYSDILTDGEMTVEFSTERQLKSGKTKEEFNIRVTQAHGDDSYAGSSSGERARADLAIAFSIGDLAHLRANKRIPFRFLDEPFESIDDSGHESIVRLLSEQKEQYGSVFCITHKAAFQQLFPRALVVVKENGVSRLEEEHE